MILLKFTVRNHRSIRDEVSLDLTRPSLRTLQPKDGDWLAATYRIAGIFGGNGTGKSAVVDALHFALAAVAESSTAWQASRTMRRVPFRLEAASRDASSTYELEFVVDGRRHAYGFEIDARGVKREWLRDVPTSRWRTLLDRDRAEKTLRPSAEVTDRELVLSRALQLPRSPFHAVAVELTEHVDLVLVHHSHREARLAAIADMLADGSVTFTDLQSLLQVADIGVTDVSLEERDMPEHIRAAFSNFMRAMNVDEEPRGESEGEPAEGPDNLD
ncbi:AAA family ATPase [Nigerium massiliense]|uniref:AAA family ATPase n=1 Tax=Nigerium massiliense TaxID=1522317 RepID=UPI00058E687E|nr:AAA family ATPase [Nigerium massiliense]